MDHVRRKTKISRPDGVRVLRRPSGKQGALTTRQFVAKAQGVALTKNVDF